MACKRSSVRFRYSPPSSPIRGRRTLTYWNNEGKNRQITRESRRYARRVRRSCAARDARQETRKGARRMPVAQEGDEGRGKLRKAAGRCRRPLIRGCPNGATHGSEAPVSPPVRGGKPGELKHLSTRRKRKQNVIPPVAASERGIAQTAEVPAFAGLWDRVIARSR